MATVFELADVRSLILDILSRRNWFDSKRFDEIEEQFERAGPGTSPEMFLVKGGYISDQEIASLYAEELFLPLVLNTSWPARRIASLPSCCPRSSASTSSSARWRSATKFSTWPSSRPRKWEWSMNLNF